MSDNVADAASASPSAGLASMGPASPEGPRYLRVLDGRRWGATPAATWQPASGARWAG